MRLKVLLVGTLVAALAVWLVPAAAATNGKRSDTKPATINVVHGIPGANVDVCARGDITNGEFVKVITMFEYTQIEKLKLPAGTYDANVIAAGGKCDEPLPGLSAAGLEVPAGANISIIANLTNNEKAPFTLTVGVNDTSKLDRGKARVTAYHAAKAPAVDIRAAARDAKSYAIASYGDFGDVFAGVENGQSGATEVEANRYKIAIVASGAKIDTAVKTLRTKLKRHKNTIFYAVGSLEDSTFTVLKQRVKTDRHHHHSKWWKHGKHHR